MRINGPLDPGAAVLLSHPACLRAGLGGGERRAALSSGS